MFALANADALSRSQYLPALASRGNCPAGREHRRDMLAIKR
jgi:hypothetical protein